MRISGTGPEKSLPVIRESVFISDGVVNICRRNRLISLTNRDAIVEAMIYPSMVFLVFDFELVLA